MCCFNVELLEKKDFKMLNYHLFPFTYQKMMSYRDIIGVLLHVELLEKKDFIKMLNYHLFPFTYQKMMSYRDVIGVLLHVELLEKKDFKMLNYHLIPFTYQKMMSYRDVIGVLLPIKLRKEDTPMCHHGQTVSLSDGIVHSLIFKRHDHVHASR